MIIFDKDINKVSQNESVKEVVEKTITRETFHHLQGITQIQSELIMLRIKMIRKIYK